ncbi:MAG: lipid II flippase MurJ, partial [Treponema sp.]
ENPARAMAVGVITGGVVQALFQLPFVLKNNWKITFTSLKNAFTNPGTRTVLKLIGPTIIGMACYQLNDLVSSVLANRAGVGVYSSIQYSLRLQELILGIFAVSIGTVILPDLTGFAKEKLWDKFNSMLTQAIKIMAVIAIPITFYALIMNRNLITLLFSSGKFNEESVSMTMKVFTFHIIGLYFIAVNRIISPAFYAQGNTILPTIAGIIDFVVNIALAAILVKPMSGPGIALALTIASAANTVALFLFLRKTPTIQVGAVVKSTLIYALKIIVFSVIASVPVYFLRAPILKLFAGHSRIISQGIPILITAVIFFIVGVGLLVITKDPIVQTIVNKLSRRKNSTKTKEMEK